MKQLPKRLYGVIDTQMVLSSIRKWFKRPMTANQSEIVEDLVADAIMKYEADKGCAMTTWICYYVPRVMSKYEEKYFEKVTSLDEGRNDDEGNLYNLVSTTATNTEKIVMKNYRRSAVKALINSLDERGKIVMQTILYQLEDSNNTRAGQRIATQLGISRERARQLTKQYMLQAKKYLQKEQLIDVSEINQLAS